MGLFSNPANWQITDSFQGQKGGINPVKAVIKYTSPLGFAGDVVKDELSPFQVNNSRNPGNVTVATNPQVAPQNTSGNQTNTTVGSGGGGSSFDPASVLEAQNAIDQANQLLSTFGGKRDIFNNNLTNTFAKYRDNLAQDFSRNQGQYQNSKTQTIQDQERANQQIRVMAGQKANALQRFLGAHGAGDSMAARQIAPYGVARQGQQMMNDANLTYGRNLSGLDNSWNQYNTDYQNSINDLAAQQENQRKKFEADLLQQEYGARDTLSKGQAALRYAQGGDSASARALREQALPQLYQILQQIDALGNQTVAPTVKDASYVAPELQQYNIDQNLQDVQGVNPSAQSDVSPYLQWLLKQKEQDQNFFGY